MVFNRNVRSRIKSGEITSSIRIWKNARVKLGGRYPLETGIILVTGIEEIEPETLSDELAQETAFQDLSDVMAVVHHGSGKRIFRVNYEYLE